MADFLFDRRVKVLIGTTQENDYHTLRAVTAEITDLRVEFKVNKDLKKQPNSAEITITNLAEKTRAKLQDKDAKVYLQAGYKNTVKTIFVGDVRTIDHTRQGADWVTKIEAGDGDRGYSYGRVSESFAPGASVPAVIGGIFPGLKLENVPLVGTALKAVSGKQFNNGYTAHGRASAELDKVLASQGLEWSIQDGRIQILAEGGTNTESLIVLSADSGLIGSPEFSAPKNPKKPAVLKFKCLLAPQLVPGGRVEFASLLHKGVHRIVKLTHTGDTDGGDWYTEGECEIAEV